MSQAINTLEDAYPLVRQSNGNKSKRKSITSADNPRLSGEGDENYPSKHESIDIEFKSISYMHKYAREGDSEQLENLVQHNFSLAKKYVNTLNAEKLAPLHYAARYNNLKCVKILVEMAGANVNVLTDGRVAPVHFAARYRRKYAQENTQSTKSSKLHVSMSQPDINMIRASSIETSTKNASNDCLLEVSTDKINENVKIKELMGLDSQKTITWKSLVGTLGSKNEEDFKKRLLEEEEKPTADNSVILYLVSKGANPNAQDNSGYTPLHYAAMRGNEVAASQLLTLPELKTELTDKEKMTALHLACSHNNYEIGRMLLEKNPNMFSNEESGCNPFHVACGEGNERLVNLMIDMAEKKDHLQRLLTETNRDHYTALHYAVENNHFEVAKICLDKGSRPNAVTVTKKTPLHMAAHCGSVELVELLISFGAKMDVVDKFHHTAMHTAAAKNHVDVIKYLIKQGADTESRDADSYTPLLTAAAFGHTATIKLLMSFACNLMAVEKENKSVLYIAVEQNHLNTVKAILAEGCTSNLLKIPDFNSNYPLHIACKAGREDIIKALLDAGAVYDVKNESERTPMHLAAKFGRTRVVRFLGEKSHKSLISFDDENSNTPLHLAAKSGFPKVIQILLDLGADINSRNCNKWTPLDCAAANGKLKATLTLIKNYAPVNPMDKTKVTPLYLACENGHERVVNLLLRNNADVSARNFTSDDVNKGSNPLDIAIDNGHRACALAIIRTSDWKIALRNQTRSVTGFIDTPMRKLIRKMPDVAAEVFDKCTVTNDKLPDDPDFEINLNFEFLEDSYAYWRGQNISEENPEEISVVFRHQPSKIYADNEKLLPTAKLYTSDTKQIKNNHPLTVMVQSEREELLDHPLVTNLLKMKWNNFGKLVYYTNLSSFILFLISMLVYMSMAVPPYQYFLRNKTKSDEETTCFHVKLRFRNERLDDSAYICKYVVIIFGSIGIVKEIIQLMINRKHYFSTENILEWLLYILAFLTVIDFSACQKEIGIREGWQWQTGTVAAFLGVINMVLFIRKVPFFGIFVVMFTDVMWTFLKFLPLFLVFIFAFAFSFYILLSNQVAFRNLANSMLRTTIMMIGEFDFDETFNSQWDESYLDNKLIFYDEVTYIIFVVFILMMSIITMNLLVGLAVDDIKAVQEKATIKRLEMQVTLALEVEGLVPEIIRRRFIIRKVTMTPNKKCNIFKRLFNDTEHPKNQWCTTGNDVDPLEKLGTQLKETADNVNQLKYKMKNLDYQTVTMKKMLSKLLTYLRIDFEEEDILEEEI